MAKTPSKPAAAKVTPSSTVQKPTSTPLPRGADPAGQASTAPRGGQSQKNGFSQNGSHPSTDQIAKRAYERYQARGGEHGSDQDDWYAAERELSGKAGGHN